MEAFRSNSNPKVIADYFINIEMRIGGCPQRQRADLGTENGHIRNIQIFLQRNYTPSCRRWELHFQMQHCQSAHRIMVGDVKYHDLHYVISILMKVEESSFVGDTGRGKSGKVECGNGFMCKQEGRQNKNSVISA